MNLSVEHLLESVLILTVFYLVYQILFINLASFKVNRYMLLSGIIAGMVLPFINFSSPEIKQLDFYYQLKTVEIFASGNVADEKALQYSFMQIAGFIYLTGAGFFTIRFVYQLIRIALLFPGSRIKKQQSFWTVYTGKDNPVFSFLYFVFVGKETENSKEFSIIMDHEKVHVVQKHSIDLLLLELLAIIQWFNLFVWLYKKQVKQNHEFLADRGVIKSGIPDQTYQELLLGNYKSLSLGFASSFNHSLTFKRLVMMKKTSSTKKSIARLLFAIPVVVFMVYFISCSKNEYLLIEKPTPLAVDIIETDEPVKESTDNTIDKPIDKTSDKTINKDITDNRYFESFAIDEKPEFPGGEVELIKFVAENTTYPQEAKEKGIQGTVYVRFAVLKTGEVGNLSSMRPEDPILEAEAFRVVGLLPKWKPGMYKGQPVNTWFIIPVKFKLQ